VEIRINGVEVTTSGAAERSSISLDASFAEPPASNSLQFILISPDGARVASRESVFWMLNKGLENDLLRREVAALVAERDERESAICNERSSRYLHELLLVSACSPGSLAGDAVSASNANLAARLGVPVRSECDGGGAAGGVGALLHDFDAVLVLGAGSLLLHESSAQQLGGGRGGTRGAVVVDESHEWALVRAGAGKAPGCECLAAALAAKGPLTGLPARIIEACAADGAGGCVAREGDGGAQDGFWDGVTVLSGSSGGALVEGASGLLPSLSVVRPAALLCAAEDSCSAAGAGGARAAEPLLAVVVPIRDRDASLEGLVAGLGAALGEHGRYAVWAVEQGADGRRFNRGALLNAGAVLAEAAGATLVALHDVDYVPVRAGPATGSCPPAPRYPGLTRAGKGAQEDAGTAGLYWEAALPAPRHLLGRVDSAGGAVLATPDQIRLANGSGPRAPRRVRRPARILHRLVHAHCP
jgi:hypothetical protein